MDFRRLLNDSFQRMRSIYTSFNELVQCTSSWYYIIKEDLINVIGVYRGNSTSFRIMLWRQLSRADLEKRHWQQIFEQRRLASRASMWEFVDAVGMFYQENVLNPLKLFTICRRSLSMVVGILMYMRANWKLEKVDHSIHIIAWKLHQNARVDLDCNGAAHAI